MNKRLLEKQDCGAALFGRLILLFAAFGLSFLAHFLQLGVEKLAAAAFALPEVEQHQCADADDHIEDVLELVGFHEQPVFVRGAVEARPSIISQRQNEIRPLMPAVMKMGVRRPGRKRATNNTQLPCLSNFSCTCR